MPVGSFSPKTEGSVLKIFTNQVAGPTSFSAPFSVSTPFNSVVFASVEIVNNPGNKLVTWTISGNSINITFYTIAANTTSGAISATQDAAGTNESGLTLNIIAVGI
jgi:hypothetical protein